MSLWTQWKKQTSGHMDEKAEQCWFSRSFLSQMSEIEGEIRRVLRDKEKLERIRNNLDYRGEPQVIQHVFDIIKRDPKNAALLREVDLAERETYAFLRGESDAPSAKYMEEYWNKYLQAYIAETEQKDGGDLL